MKPAPVDYHRAERLDQALALLDRHGDEARLLAGGQSLVPMLNLRIARFAHLVDINPLHEPRLSARGGGRLEIGALTRHARSSAPSCCNAVPDPPAAAKRSAMSRSASAAPWVAAWRWPIRRAICP